MFELLYLNDERAPSRSTWNGNFLSVPKIRELRFPGESSSDVLVQPHDERRQRRAVLHQPVGKPRLAQKPRGHLREPTGEPLHLQELGARMIRLEPARHLLVIIVTADRIARLAELRHQRCLL